MQSSNKSAADNGSDKKTEKRHPVQSLFLTGNDKEGAKIISKKLKDKPKEKPEIKHEQVKPVEKKKAHIPDWELPGQKEFHKKRLADIKNKESNVVKPRAGRNNESASKALKTTLKIVKKIFKKK